jgi:hypothetical protein
MGLIFKAQNPEQIQNPKRLRKTRSRKSSQKNNILTGSSTDSTDRSNSGFGALNLGLFLSVSSVPSVVNPLLFELPELPVPRAERAWSGRKAIQERFSQILADSCVSPQVVAEQIVPFLWCAQEADSL